MFRYQAALLPKVSGMTKASPMRRMPRGVA